jgi:hypothetical protein
VAEHSVRVYKYSTNCNANKVTRLAALLHDATEAYLSDITRPVKYSIPAIKDAEILIAETINEKYNLWSADWIFIKEADNILLASEARDLMPSKGSGWNLPEPLADIIVVPKYSYQCWNPSQAEHYFLSDFESISKEPS